MLSDLLLCEQPSLMTRTVSPSFHSLVVSPKVEPSPHFPVNSPPPVSPMHHTNPFSHSQSTPPPLSPCNPFFSLLQQNPFYDNTLTAQPLKAPLPPLPYLSSSRPPISHLFPQTNDPNEPLKGSDVTCGGDYSDTKSDGGRAGKRPLPPTPADVSSRRPPNPFTSAGGLEPDSQWDDSFEAFAAGRLQPGEGAGGGGASCDPSRGLGWETRNSTSQVTFNLAHFDGFAQFLETIPEHNDGVAFDNPAVPLKDAAPAEHDHASSSAAVQVLSHTHVDPAPPHPTAGKLNSSSPDPASSGIGSSVEEDFLSCLSSYSDKFSASSAEESEAPAFIHTLAFGKPCEPVGKSSESDDDRSDDPSLVGVQRDEVLDGSEAPRPPLRVAGGGPQPTRSDPQTNSKESNEREEFHVPAGSSPPAHVLLPTLHIVTSSPDVERSSAGLLPPSEVFPVSPGDGFDDLLAAPPSDLSGSSFLQSLYLSSDSQSYQTCGSRWSSQRSGHTLHSLDSTLCGELADVLAGADAARELFPDASAPHEEVHQTSSSAVLPPVTAADPPAASTDPRRKLERRLTDRPLHAASDDTFPKSPQAQTLQRSHSEGSLSLTSEEPPSPDFPALTSSAPLTPDHARSPLALCSLPPFANAAARSPPSPPRAAAPNPVSLERQQQAANQQHR